MIIMMLIVCGVSAAEPEVRTIETAADADEWAGIFLGEHPEELEGTWAMTEEMEQALSAYGGIKGLSGALAAYGAVKEVGAAYEEEIQGYRAFHIPCVFAVRSLDVILVTQDGEIAGLNFGAFTGQEEKEESDVFDEIELALPVPSLDGELPGTLTVPKGEGLFPAVILVHGSGPNDRDETVGSQKPFKDLAEGLAGQGIAVYRFDKRTYVYGGELSADHHATLMDESVEDAVNAVQLISRQEKIDPDRIYVLGHSLGGNAIPAIARELEKAPVKACGFIMMAASPRPLDVLMREQYDFLYSLLPEITEEQQAEKEAIFSDLDKLENLDEMTEDDAVMGVYAPYWKWLKEYDILQAADKISSPVLLLQGEEDYQVTMEDFGIWKDNFGEKDNWQLISYPGLTHAFTPGKKTEGAAVYSRAEKIDAQVIKDIAGFITKE